MLETTLEYYEAAACGINWQKCDRNELFRKCAESEGTPLYDSLYSALVCRHWPYVFSFYRRFNHNVPVGQCYDMLINTLNYTIKNRVWETSLKGDPKGPEKAFNESKKHFMFMKVKEIETHKRKANNYITSIDEIADKYDDFSHTIFNCLEYERPTMNLAEFYVSRKELFKSTVIELIYSGIKRTGVASAIKKLCNSGENILFAYGTSDDEFAEFLKSFESISTKKINNKVMTVLNELKIELEG